MSCKSYAIYYKHYILSPYKIKEDNSDLLKNPDGTIIQYCKPYIIQHRKKYPFIKYFTFSSYFSFDYFHSTKNISQAKTVIIKPRKEANSYCYDNNLYFSISNTFNENNFINRRDEVILIFIEPSYLDYIYLTKSGNKYYYLNNVPSLINIGDFQTQTDFYSYSKTEWALESNAASGFKNIIFIPKSD